MPQPLTQDEQWARLKKWLGENIEALNRGSLERLPKSFTGERAEAAILAYETCLEAMRFLENWEKYGLPREEGRPAGHDPAPAATAG